MRLCARASTAQARAAAAIAAGKAGTRRRRAWAGAPLSATEWGRCGEEARERWPRHAALSRARRRGTTRSGNPAQKARRARRTRGSTVRQCRARPTKRRVAQSTPPPRIAQPGHTPAEPLRRVPGGCKAAAAGSRGRRRRGTTRARTPSVCTWCGRTRLVLCPPRCRRTNRQRAPLRASRRFWTYRPDLALPSV